MYIYPVEESICFNLQGIHNLKGGFYMGTAITLAILLAVVGLAVRRMVRDKKSGKSLQCGGDCSKCRGCH